MTEFFKTKTRNTNLVLIVCFISFVRITGYVEVIKVNSRQIPVTTDFPNWIELVFSTPQLGCMFLLGLVRTISCPRLLWLVSYHYLHFGFTMVRIKEFSSKYSNLTVGPRATDNLSIPSYNRSITEFKHCSACNQWMVKIVFTVVYKHIITAFKTYRT